ncbi:MAG TPA: polysaccharide deacetylase family protein [Polyangia bacterium]|nr:polysaccharide deacetylase family protein [Polyangia bacterium]
MRRVCSVSVDVDPIACYYRIHGLSAPPAALADVVMRRGVPRFVELFTRRRIPATFFLVGQCLQADSGRAAAGELARAGFELGNHTDTHPYELARLSRSQIAREVEDAHERIAAAAGKEHAPVGFRAPGYDVSPSVLDVLAELGYRYDSSLFPSPPYYLAKAGVMLAMVLRGRTSGSVMGDPRALLAPAQPYRPDLAAPWRRGQAPMVELPVAVAPGTRLPLIGTSIVLLPTALRARLLEWMRARSFFNLELHGLDLIDADEDGIPAALVARQPDLRRPLSHKRRALEATLDRLALEYEFAPLRQVAADVQREGRV